MSITINISVVGETAEDALEKFADLMARAGGSAASTEAEAVEQPAPKKRASKTKAKAEPEPQPEPEPEVTEDDEPELPMGQDEADTTPAPTTRDDVVAVMKEYVAKFGMAEMEKNGPALLGAKKVSELEPAQYSDAVANFRQALASGKTGG